MTAAAARGGPPQSRSYDDLKKERDGRLDRLARLLDDARAYAKAPGPNRPRDLVLESLVPVVEKRVPLFTSANTEREIKDAVAFAERVGVRIVISGGSRSVDGRRPAEGEEHPGDPRPTC